MQQHTFFSAESHVQWTQKFALPFVRIAQTSLQKITATDKGELVLSVYKPQDDRSLVVLSMKKGESGISLTHARPVSLKQPNSFVQIARKYIQGRKIIAAYTTLSPVCVVLEFAPFSQERLEEDPKLQEGPNALVLDLDAKPPRLILAKKERGLPVRYQAECASQYKAGDDFFECWCEWSEENTKTKRRAAFAQPLVGFCPLLPRELKVEMDPRLRGDDSAVPRDDSPVPRDDSPVQQNDVNVLSILPTHIRKAAKTRLQFLERRLQRQKADLPTTEQIAALKSQCDGLKTNLYLWPKDSLTWHVPQELQEEHNLKPVYLLKKGEKPSAVLTTLFREIEILERRTVELTKRIRESERTLAHFVKLMQESSQYLAQEIENYCAGKYAPDKVTAQLKRKVTDIVIARASIIPLSQLCKILEIELIESEQLHKIKKEKEQRLPYKQYTASTGQFIRVGRSAADGEQMLKLMPSHHYWFHVLSGEGSHVWLEKLKGEKKPSPAAVREASILAVHHSKQSRGHSAEVQFAMRADVEKKKNLPVGKVLVRRCESFMIRYEDDELKKIIEG